MEQDKKKKVLVVGDVMIDRYTHVTTDRNAPEANIPVWDKVREEKRLGGAANTALNIKSLGGDDIEVYLAGIMDLDARQMIGRCGIDVSISAVCSDAETMYKDRYVNDGKIVFRCDSRKSFASHYAQQLVANLNIFLVQHDMFDAVIFSDYCKGTIIGRTAHAAMVGTKKQIVVVDSKKVDLSMFSGAHLLNINENEYAVQVARGPYTNVESLFDYVVVTHGAKGAELRQNEDQGSGLKSYIVHSENFPVEKTVAKDVTGCGDTHTAAMTFSLLLDKDVRKAVRFANACARNVVQKFGTSTSNVSLADLGV